MTTVQQIQQQQTAIESLAARLGDAFALVATIDQTAPVINRLQREREDALERLKQLAAAVRAVRDGFLQGAAPIVSDLERELFGEPEPLAAPVATPLTPDESTDDAFVRGWQQLVAAGPVSESDDAPSTPATDGKSGQTPPDAAEPDDDEAPFVLGVPLPNSRIVEPAREVAPDGLDPVGGLTEAETIAHAWPEVPLPPDCPAASEFIERLVNESHLHPLHPLHPLPPEQLTGPGDDPTVPVTREDLARELARHVGEGGVNEVINGAAQVTAAANGTAEPPKPARKKRGKR